ncbi:MAG: helix-turn-helix domain-containing protein [Thermoprotei archaeon]
MPKTTSAPKLFEFGLSDHESRIYATLVAEGPCTMSELAHKSSVPRTKVYPNIRRLAKKGFVDILPQKPFRCRAVSPEEALKSILKDKEDELNDMRGSYEALLEAFRNSHSEKGVARNEFWIMDNLQNSVETVRNELSQAKYEALFLVGTLGTKILLDLHQYLVAASGRGIKIRILASSNDHVQKLGSFAGFAEIKMVPQQVNDSICVIDAKTVMIFCASRISDPNSRAVSTIYVNEPRLCETFRWFINSLAWENSPSLESVVSLMESAADPSKALKAASSSIYSNAVIYSFGQWLMEKYGFKRADEILGEVALRALDLIEKEEGIKVIQNTIDKTLKVIADVASISENIEVEFNSEDPLKSLLYFVNGASSVSYRKSKLNKSNHLFTAWAMLTEAAFSRFGFETHTLQTVYDETKEVWITKKRVTVKGTPLVRLDQVLSEISNLTMTYVTPKPKSDTELSDGPGSES